MAKREFNRLYESEHGIPPLEFPKRPFGNPAEHINWCREWDEVCKQLKATGADLSRIRLAGV